MKTLSHEELSRNFAAVRQRYAEKARQTPVSILLFGQPGTGKTSTLMTAPRPIRIYAFDPSYEAVESVRTGIREGWALVELLNDENSENPTVYKRFKEIVEHEVSSGFLNAFGTVAIDVLGGNSGGLIECIANAVRKNPKAFNVAEADKPRPIGGLKRGDYQTVYELTRIYIRMLQSTGALCVATMHTVMETVTKEVQTSAGVMEIERTRVELATFAKLRPIVMALFSERYHLKKTMNGRAVKYVMLTEYDGELDASTKIGKGRFEAQEVPDLKVLLKKAGIPVEDKPYNF